MKPGGQSWPGTDFNPAHWMFISCADFPTDKDFPCSHLGYAKVIKY